MSSTGSNKESTFNSAAVNNINSDNIGQPTSASIIASMSKISGCDIKSASLVVDGFWDYIENRNEHWRKDTNTLTIPNFGTFTIKPFYNGKIKKKKIGIIKFIGSEFIYRNKKGQWNKPQIQKLQISFSLSPKVDLNKDRKGFGAMRSESHSKWTNQNLIVMSELVDYNGLYKDLPSYQIRMDSVQSLMQTNLCL